VGRSLGLVDWETHPSRFLKKTRSSFNLAMTARLYD
jgi:hypothetical protein